MKHSSVLFAIFLVAGSLAQSQEDLDLVELKKNTQVFEKILTELLRQDFSNPFALTREPEGAYLRGFGVAVSFHLNINRSRIRTIFGELPSSSKEARPKQEQIRQIKESMIRCLADYGTTFKQLTSPNRISITGHVEDRNEMDPSKKVIIVVISASRADLNLLATQEISFDKFKERVSVVEY